MKTSKCLKCRKTFSYYPSIKSGRYCSRKCWLLSTEHKILMQTMPRAIWTPEMRNAVSLRTRGKKQSQEWINNRLTSFKKTWDKRGRLSDKYTLIKAGRRFLNWRNCVYKRDNFTCQNCGDDRGGNLEAHHVISLVSIVNNWNKYEHLLYDINNGLTLCKDCHKKTDTYGKKYIHQ